MQIDDFLSLLERGAKQMRIRLAEQERLKADSFKVCAKLVLIPSPKLNKELRALENIIQIQTTLLTKFRNWITVYYIEYLRRSKSFIRWYFFLSFHSPDIKLILEYAMQALLQLVKISELQEGLIRNFSKVNQNPFEFFKKLTLEYEEELLVYKSLRRGISSKEFQKFMTFLDKKQKQFVDLASIEGNEKYIEKMQDIIFTRIFICALATINEDVEWFNTTLNNMRSIKDIFFKNKGNDTSGYIGSSGTDMLTITPP